jgi:SAM-dependent methyltransferase
MQTSVEISRMMQSRRNGAHADDPHGGRAEDAGRRTIADFGEQWTRFTANEGYYGSVELLADILGPLLAPGDVAGARVAEIGAGTGRIVKMLLDAGAASVLAIEPSAAFEVLRGNTAPWADRIEYLQATGEHIPADRALDYVFSIGVLHHIPDPLPVVRAAYLALRPGGSMVAWVYGFEGNEAYLRIASPLRALTTRLPDPLLAGVAYALNAVLSLYIPLCLRFRLPLHAYIRGVLSRFSWRTRQIVVYDQLNPAVARYYRKEEARALLEQAGFSNVRLFHRHGYSWTVAGIKPAAPAGNPSGRLGDGRPPDSRPAPAGPWTATPPSGRA